MTIFLLAILLLRKLKFLGSPFVSKGKLLFSMHSTATELTGC
jgi:hypothetical protein